MRTLDHFTCSLPLCNTDIAYLSGLARLQTLSIRLSTDEKPNVHALSDDLPSSKQVKANEEEEIPEKGEMESEPGLSLPSAGDLPMTDEDAQKILDILEMYALGPALTPYPSF